MRKIRFSLYMVAIWVTVFYHFACIKVKAAYKAPAVTFWGHSANIGWQSGPTSNLGVVGGIYGNDNIDNWIEAIAMAVNNSSVSGSINYQAYVSPGRSIDGEWYCNDETAKSGAGFLNTVSNGAASGTEGIGKPLEGLKIWLSGELANGYDVHYRVFRNYTMNAAHASGGYAYYQSWSDWASNGEYAGTTDRVCPISAYQVYLTAKKYTQTTNHYMWNEASNKWSLFKTTSEDINYGTDYTPKYITPPSGYYEYNKSGTYTVTKACTSSAYYYPIANNIQIKYPVDIVVDENGNGTYEIGVKGAIYRDEKINITTDDRIYLSEIASLDKKEDITLNNELSKNILSQSDINAYSMTYIKGRISGQSLTAGKWRGSFGMKFSVISASY